MAASAYTLVIGDKQLSSWSLRPWLLMRQAGIAFDEVLVQLRQPSTKADILKHSPAGQLPILKAGALRVWDSLAIAEYLNERHPRAQLWPADSNARAEARSVAAEMHSGFRELRMGLPMEFASSGLTPQINEACAGEIRRVVEIWCQARKQYGATGPFLFGGFSIADAMYAPVASRFSSYVLKLADYGDDGTADFYRSMMISLPAMIDWGLAARAV